MKVHLWNEYSETNLKEFTKNHDPKDLSIMRLKVIAEQQGNPQSLSGLRV